MSSDKKKPRGKPFTGKNDPRRSNAGQRSREAVQTAAQMRDMIVQVLNEPAKVELPPAEQLSKLEVSVRQAVNRAMTGDTAEFHRLMDRIWGKANQQVDVTSSDGSMTPQVVQFIPYVSADNASA